MNKIAVISTGGTISMKNNNTGLAVPTVGAKDLVESINFPKDNIVIEEIDFCNVPSAHLQLNDLVNLRNLIIELSNKDYDGLIITHGTDTMEETAYFLDITIDLKIPVIITGSQRNLSAISSDVYLNLSDSLLVANDNKSTEMGVLVVFSSEVFAAREVTKTHRTSVSTFKSPEFGPIATIVNNKVVWFRKPLIRETYEIGDISNITVDIIPCFLGSNSENMSFCISNGAKGIILQSLGAGHVPESMIDGIEEALVSSIPVVLSSRTYCGRFLTNTYGFKGSEKHLKSIGVIFGEDLSSQKLRIKLLVLLSQNLTQAELRNAFENVLYE